MEMENNFKTFFDYSLNTLKRNIITGAICGRWFNFNSI